MFSVGSLIVAVGAVLLLVAVATHLLTGRALTGAEMLLAAIGSSVAGYFWWRAIQRKIKQQHLEALK
jgi:uncharacterized membrane protein